MPGCSLSLSLSPPVSFGKETIGLGQTLLGELPFHTNARENPLLCAKHSSICLVVCAMIFFDLLRLHKLTNVRSSSFSLRRPQPEILQNAPS